jgi:hypothetical protein
MHAYLLPPSVAFVFRSTSGSALLSALVLLGACNLAVAQDGSAGAKPVYRCPGPPITYTDGLTAQEAKNQGCRTIEGASITVVQAPSRARPANAAGPWTSPGGGQPPAGAARAGETRVDPAAQRARDTDARRILTEELKREEERLQALLKDFNGGEPERHGDERNFVKYQERVAELKASVARKEADVAALRRELSKLSQ